MTDLKPKYVTRYTWTGRKEKTKTKKRKVVVGTETVEKSGLLGKKSVEKQITETETYEAPTGKSITGFPDIEDLALRIQQICNELDSSGYDVFNVSPVQIGDWHAWENRQHNGSGAGYGYGMGITRGAIITGKLKD